MTRRALALFAASSFLWGIPYLLIKVAVDDLSPALIVFARTAIAAALLAPLAVRAGMLAPLRHRLGAVAALSLVAVTIPFMLITAGERYISSSLAGLLIALVPLIAALLALRFGDDTLGRTSVVGLFIGIGGVGVLLGVDIGGNARELLGATMLISAAFFYACAAIMIGRLFKGTPPLGLATGMLACTALTLSPAAVFAIPEQRPPLGAVVAVAALAVASTALGYVVFFALVEQVGSTRATVVAYVAPAVAVAVGVAFLDEPFTAATAAGVLLVLTGSALATRRKQPLAAPARAAT